MTDCFENLIGSTNYGNMLIWNFHKGKLLIVIPTVNKNYGRSDLITLYGICLLWDNEHIFVGCGDNTIKLIELKTRKIVKIIKGHYDKVLNVKKIYHPKYKDCIISSSYNQIK